MDVEFLQQARNVSDEKMCELWGLLMGTRGTSKKGTRLPADSGATEEWWNAMVAARGGKPTSLRQ